MSSLGRWSFETPPGFQGLDVRRAVVRHSRHLPHWRQDGATYFVTFRQADSLPQGRLNQIKQIRCRYLAEIDGLKSLESTPETDRKVMELSLALSTEIMKKLEGWLDQGMGSCVLADHQARRILQKSLVQVIQDTGSPGAFVLMPNHVHLLICPAVGIELGDILRQVKRGSARLINSLLKQEGSLWSAECYDRIVRDGEHLWRCLQYIGRNPRKASLKQGTFARWVHPDWESCGWGFMADRDETCS